jgi:hypothetical protein
MKKLLCIVALFSGIGYVNAQKLKEADVPAAVTAKFKSLHADVTIVKWEKENGNYEANYDKGKTEMSVTFDATGKLLETEESIAATALPKTVTDYITKNLPGKKIKEASKITNGEGKMMYEAEVEGTDYTFDENGNFLKKAVDND